MYQRYGKGTSNNLAQPAQALFGIRKAAILMVSLDTATAAALMGQLEKEDIELLVTAIASLDNVTTKEQDGVVEEFYRLGAAHRYIDQGGISFAQQLLEQSLPPEQAKGLIEQVKLSLHSSPFSFLRKTPGDQLAQFLIDEHPQAIALVLAHLLPEQASSVLQSLPSTKQLEVTWRIANMEQTSPEVIKDVEEALEQRLSSMLSQELEEVGGASSVAGMLNYTDRATEKAILESLEAEDPDLVEEVRRLMFVFDDIERVDQRSMMELLKEIENDTLSLALKGASNEMKEKFFCAMSERAGLLVKENMEYLGPVRLSEVERAQQEIVDIVRRLADAGNIGILDRGMQEEMVI